MATKHDDGCFQKAEDDEPLFTLLARDPLAPFLVRLWGALRETRGEEGAGDARVTAHEMDTWRKERRPEKAALDRETIRETLTRLGF